MGRSTTNLRLGVWCCNSSRVEALTEEEECGEGWEGKSGWLQDESSQFEGWIVCDVHGEELKVMLEKSTTLQ